MTRIVKWVIVDSPTVTDTSKKDKIGWIDVGRTWKESWGKGRGGEDDCDETGATGDGASGKGGGGGGREVINFHRKPGHPAFERG